MGNFKLTIFFILGPDLENEKANIKNNYTGSRNKICNKIYGPIDPSLLPIVCQGVLNITVKDVLLH